MQGPGRSRFSLGAIRVINKSGKVQRQHVCPKQRIKSSGSLSISGPMVCFPGGQDHGVKYEEEIKSSICLSCLLWYLVCSQQPEPECTDTVGKELILPLEVVCSHLSPKDSERQLSQTHTAHRSLASRLKQTEANQIQSSVCPVCAQDQGPVCEHGQS